MKITPINNSQTNFRGLADSSTEKYIQCAVRNECREIKERVHEYDRQILQKELDAVRSFGQYLISRINCILAKCHPDTILSFEHFKTGNAFVLRNNRLPKRCYVKISDAVTSPAKPISEKTKDKSYSETFSEIGRQDLDLLNAFANNLQEVNPNELDKKLYEQSLENVQQMAKNTGLIGQIKTTIAAIKTDKFGDIIGIEDSTVLRDSVEWIGNAQDAENKIRAEKRLKKKLSEK